MKRLAPVMILLAAAAAAEGAKQDSWKPFSVTLEAKKMHEECIRLEKGDKRRYHWKSDAPVDFNIHYHKQTEVFYPVKRDGMRGDGGTFNPKTGEEYCWMWTARNAPAKVEGRIEVK